MHFISDTLRFVCIVTELPDSICSGTRQRGFSHRFDIEHGGLLFSFQPTRQKVRTSNQTQHRTKNLIYSFSHLIFLFRDVFLRNVIIDFRVDRYFLSVSR